MTDTSRPDETREYTVSAVEVLEPGRLTGTGARAQDDAVEGAVVAAGYNAIRAAPMQTHAHADQQHDHSGHDHHEMPSSGRTPTAVAVSATLHCLTGCAIGEIAGMAIGTALGFSNLGTVALSVLLAFVFGYGLTSLPLLRAGLALSAMIPIALASDTFSIATMQVVDNAVVLAVPGALNAGLGTLLFWGSLAFSLAIAFVAAVPLNRWLNAPRATPPCTALASTAGRTRGWSEPSSRSHSCSAPRS
jgi:hypothetical protein